MLFQPTISADQPALMRLSDFHRQRRERPESVADTLRTRHSRLGESLMQDLSRFQRESRPAELLEVLAASVRHGRNLLVHVQAGDQVLALTVYPNDGQLRCELTLDELLALPLDGLRVLDFEPPLVRPLGERRRGGSRNTGPRSNIRCRRRTNPDDVVPGRR